MQVRSRGFGSGADCWAPPARHQLQWAVARAQLCFGLCAVPVCRVHFQGRTVR